MAEPVTRISSDHVHEIVRLYTSALEQRFRDRLISIVLYGSVARGEHTSSSDIDLLIVARGLPDSYRARNRLLVELEDELYPLLVPLYRAGGYVEISTKIRTPEEARQFTPLYLDMTEDAVLLYDRDGFFESVLNRLRERLQVLGAQRIHQGTAWYWDLKPDYRWGEVIEL